ncbi:hypothetical protein [Streptomyces sp. NRRL WC-3742]|uniref:hypothetical protein n=1 Tax=Streptomyces sp. NRRL WC-3742 TaxID=1463934 RepID=UPI00131EC1AF|nr:hypothetical protein [Streptomyces sp. NRRL WC-3742]
MQLYAPFRRTVVVGATVLALMPVAAAPALAGTADSGDGTVAAAGSLSEFTGVERLTDDTDPAADQAVQDSWTPEAMQAARPVEAVTDQPQAAVGDDVPTAPVSEPSGPLDQGSAEPADPAEPLGAPTTGLAAPRGSWPSNGVPSVGAFFFDIGPVKWRCTGTVINTGSRNIVATAGHCIFNHFPSPNGVFVPGYHDGQAPFGKWSVKSRYIPTQWRNKRNPDFDYGFVVLKDLNRRRIQDVTGANGWRTNAGYNNYVEITGYPGNRDTPLQCITATHRLRNYTWHVEFPCDGFADGVSGSLLMENFNNSTSRGTAIASLGGVDGGGRSDNVSSAVLWNSGTAAMINAAVRGQ